MTDEEYQRLQNLLSTVVEQQALFAENQTKAEARMTRHEESIASLLASAELHDRQFVETDERINALVNVVEKYISRDE
ncbi:MAG: hypothetical protein ACRD8U_18005 [Pyrinomonadaceae bacterium]